VVNGVKPLPHKKEAEVLVVFPMKETTYWPDMWAAEPHSAHVWAGKRESEGERKCS